MPLSAAEVDRWMSEQRAAGRRVGYTCGAFDLLHAGHVDYLHRARGLCDRLLVAVNSDISIQRYKNSLRPINPEQERMAVIAALRSVDAVTQLDEERPVAQLLRWRPDFYIKGGDYHPDKLRSGLAVRAYGGQVLVLPVSVSTSTSEIVRRIAAMELHEPPEPARPADRIVFLDRDGTLIRDVPFLSDPEQVELLPGVGEGLAELQSLGFRLVLVTNQQGIGLGYYSAGDFIRVNQALFRKLAPFGVRISRVLYCPHSLGDECDCRKPGALLIERALRHYGVAAEKCYLVGDRRSDVEAGLKAGCPSILLEGPFAGAVEWIRSSEAAKGC